MAAIQFTPSELIEIDARLATVPDEWRHEIRVVIETEVAAKALIELVAAAGIPVRRKIDPNDFASGVIGDLVDCFDFDYDPEAPEVIAARCSA